MDMIFHDYQHEPFYKESQLNTY